MHGETVAACLRERQRPDRPGPILFDAGAVQRRVAELAEEIDEAFKNRGPPLVVGVLKGAAFFTSDLTRRLPGADLDWVWLSTYGRSTERSEVRLVKDLDQEVRDRHVLLVDDIFDSGTTLGWLHAHVAGRSPLSIDICTLLCKSNATDGAPRPRFVGFTVDVDWVAGYGIDYAEQHRGWADIHAVDISTP